MAQKLISMSQKELSRYEVITRLIAKKINGTMAAKLLNLTVRQIQNLKARVKKFGAKGLIHGNRGRESNRKIKQEIIGKVKEYLKEKYYDFGPKFASEKLEENHKIKLGKETVRQIMIAEKLWKPKPRRNNKEYRSWRPRKEQYGEMQQFDGSYEKWFEDRAPERCLLAAIDDGTGKITHARFDHHEGVVPVFNFWRGYVETNGKPMAVYLDKFSTYKINHKSAADNQDLMTQFQRATMDLGINLITAHSPQAKGRIERLFETLQDRLIKEMRLHNISDMETANKFLAETFIPKFNQQFSVASQKKGDLHKKITDFEKHDLEKIFSIQNMRLVNNDFTISFKNKWFQLNQEQPALVLKKSKVLIEERLDGTIKISLRNKYLNFKELPERPKKIIDIKLAALTKTKSNWIPPKDHPWRQPLLYGKLKQNTPTLTSKNS